jgi:hypothetical protein
MSKAMSFAAFRRLHHITRPSRSTRTTTVVAVMPSKISFRDPSSRKTKPGPSNRSDSCDSTEPAQPSRSLWKRAISTITTRLADGRAEYHAHIAEARKELERARRRKEKLKDVEKWRNEKGVTEENGGERGERKEKRAGDRPGEGGEKRRRRRKKGKRRTSRRGGDAESDGK